MKTKCLRICGAMSFRMTKKHSTIVLIASFIFTITIILKLYSGKDSTDSHSQHRISSYEYEPGAFMKGVKPDIENLTSFCNFNYGLPYELNWRNIPIHLTPEVGGRSTYRVIYDVLKGNMYNNYSRINAVTYATHATPELLYHIIEVARFWEGPISLAVFVPDYDMDLAFQLLIHLCSCFEGMSKVSVHLVYPKHLLPVLTKRKKPVKPNIVTSSVETQTESTQYAMYIPPHLNHIEKAIRRFIGNETKAFENKTRSEIIYMIRQKKAERLLNKLKEKEEEEKVLPQIHLEDCSNPDISGITTYRKLHRMIYPVNVCRNVARNASATSYFLVSDIEMVPSDGLATKFVNMVRRLLGEEKYQEGCIFQKTVFIVPLFEVQRGEDIPRDKETLMRLVEMDRANYFHQKSCSHCQRFPGLQTWLAKKPKPYLEPVLVAKREYPYHRWEPLFFGTNQEPWYSEVLSWEGRQDKMTQMLEMCLLQYRLVVLDGGFLCHAATSPSAATAASDARLQQRAEQERRNSRHYANIVRKLRAMHNNPSGGKCRLK